MNNALPGTLDRFWTSWIDRLTTSAIVLIAANLIPLAGVFVFGWQTFPIVLLYWFENVVVGVSNVARMICSRPDDVGRWIGKAFMIPFFIVHYGMFTAVHGVFVFALFGQEQYLEASFIPRVGTVWAALYDHGVLLAAIALVASHAFSFLWNYIGKGEYSRASLETLMHQPYGRIVVLHIAIIFGGWIVLALGSPVGGLVLLVMLKIGMDVRAHLREHDKLQSRVRAAEPDAA